jgi:hypothetical protein
LDTSHENEAVDESAAFIRAGNTHYTRVECDTFLRCPDLFYPDIIYQINYYFLTYLNAHTLVDCDNSEYYNSLFLVSDLTAPIVAACFCQI